MKKTRKATSPQEQARRNHVWRHNGYFGYARMMQMQAQAIAEAPSTTWSAKVLAKQIHSLARELNKELATRVDTKAVF